MSAVIELCSGRVHVFPQGRGSSGVGYYKLDPEIQVGNGGRCLIVGAPKNMAELVAPVATLDDKRIIYSFGSAWTEMQLYCKILLGPIEGRGAIESVESWYLANRVSKREEPILLSAGNKGHEVFLTGAAFGAANPEFNTLDVSFRFHLHNER